MDKMYVGVDVSKEHLDVAVAGERAVIRLANSAEAVACWLAGFAPGCVALVAYEPTGGYERVLAQGLADAGLPGVRVHPNEIAAVRRLRGVKAKTDRIDARLIAQFAQDELSRRPARAGGPTDEALRELVARRRQLRQALHAERCRLALAQSPLVADSIGTMIDALSASFEAVTRAMLAHVAADERLAARAALLMSFKGIGPIVAATLVGELPELGLMCGKKIAALVGLAPQTRESGKGRQRAATGFGRPGVRAALFNAARSAIQHNKVIKPFYERLVTENKRPGKVAITAAMRKTLVIANAIIQQNQPWKHQNA